MRIEVENDLKNHFKFDFETNIKDILRKLPKDHLVGLDRIEVRYAAADKYARDTYALYYGRDTGVKFPKIVLCVGNIFEDLPKILLRQIPLLPKLLLAKNIFHELAHHCQTRQHGISKEEQEKQARAYANKMIKRCFKYELLLLWLLFWPFLLLRSLLKKINKW